MKLFPVLLGVLSRIMLAIGVVFLTSLLLVPFRGFFSTSVVALIYLLAVLICATVGRFISGVAASVLAFLTFNYFFLPPLNTFIVAHNQDFVAMFVFLIVAIITSNLMSNAQTRLELIQAREREALHLYELSSTLTAQRDERQIAEILAGHVLEVFQKDAVEVIIQSNLPGAGCDERPCVHFRLPENANTRGLTRQSQVLATHRGELGETILWGRKGELSPNEQRLLQTICSQAVLAVERTLLSQAENRSRVLEESDKLKTAILSSVSHDLRTPLSSIQAAATSLFDPNNPLDAESKDEMQSLLLEETEHLNQLVGNLLNMSRLEAGALTLSKRLELLSDIIETAQQRMQRQATRHTIEVDIPEDLPFIPVDAVLIEQVLINLLSNSVKYAPAGSEIFIRAQAEPPGWIQVTLSNQGPPIAEEHLDHIFEKFYTFPGMRQVSSTGLGLSICKGIIEAHGGRIWAANQDGGLAFCFTLPLAKEGSRLILTEEHDIP